MCNFLRDKKRKHCFSIMRSHTFSIQCPKEYFFLKLPHSAKNLPSEFLHLTALKHNFALSLLASLVSERKKWQDFFLHPQHNLSPLDKSHKSWTFTKQKTHTDDTQQAQLSRHSNGTQHNHISCEESYQPPQIWISLHHRNNLPVN